MLPYVCERGTGTLEWSNFGISNDAAVLGRRSEIADIDAFEVAKARKTMHAYMVKCETTT